MLWIGRIETFMDGWVKYGTSHTFDKSGFTGEETISLCGKLDITDRRDVHASNTLVPVCKSCQKKMNEREV